MPSVNRVVSQRCGTFVPSAQSPTAPTRRVLVATPEVASDALRAMLTTPLTTPPGAVGATATVEVGGVVSMVIVRPGLSALASRASLARTKKQNVPSPGTAKCSACALPG